MNKVRDVVKVDAGTQEKTPYNKEPECLARLTISTFNKTRGAKHQNREEHESYLRVHGVFTLYSTHLVLVVKPILHLLKIKPLLTNEKGVS